MITGTLQLSPSQKTCKVCGRPTRSRFGICRRTRICHVAYGRIWRAQRTPDQLERQKQYQKKWSKNRPRPSRKKTGIWCRSVNLLQQGRRHSLLFEFRKEHKLTQVQSAMICGVDNCLWNAIERLRFSEMYLSWTHIKIVSDFIGVHPDDICPPEMRTLGMQYAASKETRWDMLMAQEAIERLTVPSPSDIQGHSTVLLKEMVQKTLKTLTYREREIIKLRYGIGDGCSYTLAEVGRIFRVTRERIRQLEARAIRKLQHPVRSRKLECFVNTYITKPMDEAA